MSSFMDRIIRWWFKPSSQTRPFAARHTPVNHSTWNTFLQTHVDADGQVNYAAIQADPTELIEYCKHLSEGPPNDNADAILAYWINAYNAFALLAVIHFDCRNSIREADPWIPSRTVFDRRFFTIAGQRCSLNTIEHQVLRTLNEPRIHFAINCASQSCPILHNEAFAPNKLQEQLTQQTMCFLQDERKNKFQQEDWKISPIFSWFAADFGGTKGVASFIERYRTAAGKKNIQYTRYNWRLNNKQ